MRALNSNNRNQYDIIWEECQQYLEETVSTPVDDRRRGHVTHLAQAICEGPR